jgi:cell division protease FtsH
MRKQNIKRGLVPYLFLFVAIIGIFYFYNVLNKTVNILNYGEFYKAVSKNKVEEITIIPRDRAKIYEIKGKLKDYKETESFSVKVPFSDEIIVMIIDKQKEYGFKLKTVEDPESSSLLLIIVNVLPIALLIVAVFFFVTRQLGGANKSMDFGRSRAKLHEDNKKVNFNNVAGLKEEKEEVKELNRLLKKS